MKKNMLLVVIAFLTFPLLLLTGCTSSHTPEDRISRVIVLLLSAPDQYLARNTSLDTVTTPDAGEHPLDPLTDVKYQEYLETVFSEEDFTAQCYSKLSQFRLVTLMYPALCADADIAVEVGDIKVQLELEQSRIYSVEGQAVITLGDSQVPLQISGKVQTDESGRISSIDFDGSAGEISTRCLEWINTR